MIAVDANLLVYARVSSYAQHDAARVWLEEQLVRVPRVGAAVGESAGVRAAGHQPRLFSEPESITDAWAQVVAWLDADPVWTPTPTTRHRDTLGACLAQPGLRADDVPDAHLATLAIEHGLRLATSDSGSARFPDLEWFNPMQPL